MDESGRGVQGLGLWAKQYLVSPSSSALVAATNRITGTRRPVSRQ